MKTGDLVLGQLGEPRLDVLVVKPVQPLGGRLPVSALDGGLVFLIGVDGVRSIIVALKQLS